MRDQLESQALDWHRLTGSVRDNTSITEEFASKIFCLNETVKRLKGEIFCLNETVPARKFSGFAKQ